MSRSGPGAGISTSSTVVQAPTSVFAPASQGGFITTLVLSSSSTPTPSSADAAQTPNKLATVQSPQAIQSSSPSTSLVDSSFSSSSMTNPTSIFFAVQQDLDVPPSGGPSSAIYTKAPASTHADTSSSTMSSRTTMPSRPHLPEPPHSTTESDPETPVLAAPPSRSPTHPSPPTGAHDVRDVVSFEDKDKDQHPHDDDEDKSALIISHISSGETFYTEGEHLKTKWWTELPQHDHDHDVVSTSHDSKWITIVSKTTDSGTTFQATSTLQGISPGGPVSAPTNSSNVSPGSASNSNDLLSLILGVVLGTVALMALVVAFFRLRGRRRRPKFMPKVLSSDSDTSQERKDNIMTEATPRLETITRITPYRTFSTYAPEQVTTCVSSAGESFQNSDGPLSNPFSDDSTALSTRADTRPGSLHSVDSVSTVLEPVVSVNADTLEGGESVRSIDESASSLELHFVPPPVVAGRDLLIRVPYLSPTWHYDGHSPLSSPSRVESQNEEGRGGPSNGTTPTSSRPFLLGAESARLRLHSLLKEARRV